MIDAGASPFTEAERAHLREGMKQPLWKLLNRLMDAYLEALLENAATNSSIDPLNNREALANRWAYVAAARQFRAQLLRGVAFEVGLIEAAATKEAKTEEQIRRERAWNTLGMLGPMPDNFNYKKEQQQ